MRRFWMPALCLAVVAAATNAETAITIYSAAGPGGVPFEMYTPQLQQQYYAQNLAQQIPGYAVVRQGRKVSLTKGVSDIRFTDVAALIDPTTVAFESLTDPGGTRVIDQSFEFDLVSGDKLMEKYIDRKIRLTRNLGDGKIETFEATLLSYDQGQMVLKTDDPGAPIMVSYRGSFMNIEFSELPGGLITQPTLVWNLAVDKGGEHDIRVGYQTRGIVWWADYNVTLAADEKSLDVGAWVSIINRSGATYENAKLKLVAGDVHRAPQPKSQLTMDFSASRAMAGAEMGFEEKAFFEYHLYTLGRPATIRDNSTQQIELFPTARGVPVEKVFVYYGLPEDFRWFGGGSPHMDRNLGTQSNPKVDTYLRFKNSEQNHVGMPLPAGRIRVSKADPADGSLEFIGEDAIDHTPEDEEVLVKMGSAFDIVGERKQTDFTLDTSRRTMTESFEIRLRNHKEEAVKVLVKENLFRWAEWEITHQSTDFEKIDHRTVHFPVEVPADGETVVTYTARYTW